MEWKGNSVAALLSDFEIEILLALVWSGPYLTPQLGQLFRSCWGFRQLQRRLARLERQGLIESGFFYRRRRGKAHAGQPPQRVGRVWAITAAGQAAIEHHDRTPFHPTRPVRTALLDHDTTVSAVIAHIVAHTRPLLSGLAVFREMRIDDQRAAPIADTILVMRTRGVVREQRSLPWTRQGVQPDEALRVIAIESDRSTEDLSVIAEKARTYGQVPSNPEYMERYAGIVPLPLWIAPTRRRANAIHTTWQRVWPDGSWLQTTDAGLKDDLLIDYDAGRERLRTWLDDWERWLVPSQIHNAEGV